MKTNILLACVSLLSLLLLAYRWHAWRNEIVTITSAAFYDGEVGWRIDPPIRVKAGGTVWIVLPNGDGLTATRYAFPEGAENVILKAKRKDIRHTTL